MGDCRLDNHCFIKYVLKICSSVYITLTSIQNESMVIFIDVYDKQDIRGHEALVIRFHCQIKTYKC
jgi:hypothetical protein